MLQSRTHTCNELRIENAGEKVKSPGMKYRHYSPKADVYLVDRGEIEHKILEINDKKIKDVFEGKSDKLILVIGPCSADREDAVIDYIKRLRE